MNILLTKQENQSGTLSVIEAQTEIFWLAFQVLPKEAQLAVRQRLLDTREIPEELAMELESWQVAAAEALMNFEELLHETQ